MSVPIATGDGFALGTDPTLCARHLPSLLPVDDYGITSEGIYYAARLRPDGPLDRSCDGRLLQRPLTPLSSNCAYGSGASCSACPDGALCPAARALWPRVGFWAPERGSLIRVALQPARSCCQVRRLERHARSRAVRHGIP